MSTSIVRVGETKRELLSFTAYRTVGSVDSTTDTITCNAHGFSSGNPVTFRVTAGQLPGALYDTVTYYVVNAQTNTFQVATAAGGTAIDLTSAGSGLIEVSGPYDPDVAVSLTVKDPSGTSTTYTYALSQISRAAAGLYYKDYTYSTAGTYWLQQKGQFTINAATYVDTDEWEVECQPTNV